jgi:small subunit ribosomal protein S6
MEKVICSYETLFVIKPDLTEEATAAVVNKFTALIADNGGTVENVNVWGKRRLAYPIEKFVEGYYVLVNFKSESNLPLELNRVFGITDEILRNIVVRSEGYVAPAEEKATEAAPVAEEAPAEEAAEA